MNDIEIIRFRITDEDDFEKRWPTYNSLLSEEEIKKIHSNLKQGWYMHFWRGNEIIVLFKDKKFVLELDNKDSWRDAIDFGSSINIPREQLDFEIEF